MHNNVQIRQRFQARRDDTFGSNEGTPANIDEQGEEHVLRAFGQDAKQDEGEPSTHEKRVPSEQQSGSGAGETPGMKGKGGHSVSTEDESHREGSKPVIDKHTARALEYKLANFGEELMLETTHTLSRLLCAILQRTDYGLQKYESTSLDGLVQWVVDLRARHNISDMDSRTASKSKSQVHFIQDLHLLISEGLKGLEEILMVGTLLRITADMKRGADRRNELVAQLHSLMEKGGDRAEDRLHSALWMLRDILGNRGNERGIPSQVNSNVSSASSSPSPLFKCRFRGIANGSEGEIPMEQKKKRSLSAP